jgi:hypothetical protein
VHFPAWNLSACVKRSCPRSRIDGTQYIKTGLQIGDARWHSVIRVPSHSSDSEGHQGPSHSLRPGTSHIASRRLQRPGRARFPRSASRFRCVTARPCGTAVSTSVMLRVDSRERLSRFAPTNGIVSGPQCRHVFAMRRILPHRVSSPF